MQLVPSHKLIDINPEDLVTFHHPNDIECSVLTTDNNTDINDANTTAPDRNIDDSEFASIETPNDNTNDCVTINPANQNDSVPVWRTNQNVQVVLPKQNQTVKYHHGQNPWETVTLEKVNIRTGLK